MSKEGVIRHVANDEVVLESAHSTVPTVFVFFISAALFVTTLYHTAFGEGPPMGWLGVILASVVLFSACFVYWRRTYNMRYVMTNRLFASFTGNPDEGSITLIETARLGDITYIYISRSPFAKVLSWFRITDYGDICFCEAINSPPIVIFHNQGYPEDIVEKIKEILGK